MSSVYRLAYGDGSYHNKVYLTLGRARIARALKYSRYNLQIEEMTGEWSVVDTGRPVLYDRLAAIERLGAALGVQRTADGILRQLTEEQVGKLTVWGKMDMDAVVLNDGIRDYSIQRFNYFIDDDEVTYATLVNKLKEI